MRPVHNPNIPHSGINTLKKFVTRNMRLVRMRKYRWMYQKLKVDTMEQTACVMPR